MASQFNTVKRVRKFPACYSTTTSSSQSQTSSTSKASSSIHGQTGVSSGNSDSAGSERLSPGAKVGITNAAVLAAFAIFLFIRRHRKEQATQP
ncbi:uncharacterized protein K444DRAFT_60136 [Hyaloscypha bicolor E]|uniref:Uncharacterized protein n=1 Tax=Hyaloscypha bicolor E TaxID=1095630 RepID=A0A2J6T088_9HELO|nr:uncharacterized protein K444DRAFT_60136 [Hyaloscypha bicolor E]PMD56343.1 hypothetical protein K444DRAFT_60136 [Hyaloscypha bicolor E]